MFSMDFRTLEAALAARERLQLTHAANIANVDTPNYHADTRGFDDFLRAEMRQNDIPLQQTGLQPDRKRAKMRRLDDNSVNLQQEIIRMTENQMMHELTLHLLRGKLSSLARAIKEGSR